MKIAFWHYYTFRLLRGIETLVLSLSNELVKKGHEISIVGASPTTKSLIQTLPPVKIYTFPTPRYFEHAAIIPFYTQHFLKHRYDHVVTFFSDFGEGTTESIVSLFKKLPLSLYLCYPASNVPHRYAAFKKYGWDKKANPILADADWIAKEAEDFFKRKVGVVPVGTDPERFRPNDDVRKRMRNKFGYGEKDVVLLTASSLEARKGTWRVIESVERLKKELPQLRYFVLGSGPEEARLRKRVEELNLKNTVYFGGETTELEAYYNMADIFIMLPEAEGNSVACHEAMSCELPVIVSKTPGFQENVLTDRGVFVDPNCSGDIDRAILELSNDANRRSEMGKRARQSIQAQHSWSHAADRMVRFLRP